MALPRYYRSAIAYATSNQTAVNYEEWGVLEVGDINLPIINPSVQIEKTPRIAASASGNLSLHRYYDSLFPPCNKHDATNSSPCGNKSNNSTAIIPKIIKQRIRTKNEHKSEEVVPSALDTLLQILEELY